MAWGGFSTVHSCPSRFSSIPTQPFLKNFSKAHILSDALPIYRRLQSDDQDSVRLLTVEDLIVIAQQLTSPEVKELLLKQIRHSIADKSWRVRYMAATHFNQVRNVCTYYWERRWNIYLPQLAEAVGVDLVRDELIVQYVQLLKDNEAEVRTAASGQIPGEVIL
jgi:serine/threonine-protein phosphatase 2A regulatory subunit A